MDDYYSGVVKNSLANNQYDSIRKQEQLRVTLFMLILKKTHRMMMNETQIAVKQILN